MNTDARAPRFIPRHLASLASASVTHPRPDLALRQESDAQTTTVHETTENRRFGLKYASARIKCRWQSSVAVGPHGGVPQVTTHSRRPRRANH